MPNPLLRKSKLPPFSEFKAEHGTEALKQSIEAGRKAVQEVLNDADHDYVSLVENLDKVDELLNEAWGTVGHLNSVCNSPELREVYNNGQPLLSAYAAEIGQNRELYEAYQKLNQQELSEARKAVVEKQCLSFKLSGVALEGEKRERCKAVQMKLSQLSSKFSDHVLDATMAWTRSVSAEELEGLPESARSMLSQNASSREQEGHLITLEAPSYLPVMSYAKNRDLRREVYEAYCTRASERGPHGGQFDNSEIIEEILSLRQEHSQLLGYNNYAERSLARKMAESPQQVIDFLSTLAERSRPKAKQDLEELQAHAAEHLGLEKLEAWDLMYASENLKERRYQFSQEETKPYFPLDKVVEGMFAIVKKIFDVDVEPIENPEVWHPDVRFYALKRSGTTIARFYLDPFARQHKRGGAWMGDCRSKRRWADGSAQSPVAYLVCNFTPPLGDDPSCLTHDEVTTLFHEFGHGLHHMLTEVEEPSVAGISGVAWDAVELPSQLLENWCWEPEAIPLISSHHKTGAALPDALLKKMLAAKHFQSGMMMCRQLEFALFDIRLHIEYGNNNFSSVQDLLNEVREQVAVTTPPHFNRFQHAFSHIFAGGYGAGYYSYKWAEVLSADVYSYFEEKGIFDANAGKRFLDTFLCRGGVRPESEMFAAFRGREPSVEALLRHSGISS
jgi:oligopeptidase A